MHGSLYTTYDQELAHAIRQFLMAQYSSTTLWYTIVVDAYGRYHIDWMTSEALMLRARDEKLLKQAKQYIEAHVMLSRGA